MAKWKSHCNIRQNHTGRHARAVLTDYVPIAVTEIEKPQSLPCSPSPQSELSRSVQSSRLRRISNLQSPISNLQPLENIDVMSILQGWKIGT